MSTEQFDIIDIITKDDSGKIFLVIVESREWSDLQDIIPDLYKKINSYLAYASEKNLTRWSIQLDTLAPLNQMAVEELRKIEFALYSKNIEFLVNQL